MKIDFSLSPDTQAVLLLCGALGRKDRELPPLTPGQYNVFASALNTLGKRPADLIGLGGPNEALIHEACALPNTNGRVESAPPDRIAALLRRGFTLSTALDKWASYGVRVISRADEAYPARLRKHLGPKAPALLYYAGNAELLPGGGMAFVGARDIAEEATEMIRYVVRSCVDLGMNVVSGGARGADQAAMQEAFSVGGKVIGALPCELLKACLDPANREALSGGNALLFSAFDPEVRPYSYGPVAMDRNKYIYGMADACFVAQSGKGSTSGTWSGAVEELKNKERHPVYVYLGKKPSEGCKDLLEKGAKAWEEDKSVEENLKTTFSGETACLRYGEQLELFGGLVAGESQAPYGKGTPEEDRPAGKLAPVAGGAVRPYDAFYAELRRFLCDSRKESDVKKHMAQACDLLPSQVRKWLQRAENGRAIRLVRQPSAKRGKEVVMVELAVGTE